MDKGTILVVEDSPLILEILVKFLSDKGYNTVAAVDGIDAVEKAFKELPDLIILDVMMPRMNGYQTCRLLKLDPETCDIPIVMLTVKDQTSDKYWGIHTGADAYLKKESDQTVLLCTVEALIQKKQKENGQKSIIRQGSIINPIDIVTKMNGLLDRKLFEATVLNEMNSTIESGVQDVKETINAVMGKFSKFFNFNVATIILLDEQDVECVLKVNNPVSKEYLEIVKEYVRKYLKENDVYSPDLKTTVYDDDSICNTYNKNGRDISFYNVPIRYGDKLGGNIILVHDTSEKIDSHVREFFDNVIKQAYVIINNSWLHNKVRTLAITDGLTGIYNRRFLYEALSKEFSRTKRYKQPLSFLLLDVDYFKKVNDTYGHMQGDHVLRKLSGIFQNSIRTYDILGRYGGEEFSIILPETPVELGINMAERIRKDVERENFGHMNGALKCTISIGVSSHPCEEIENIDELIDRADKALYKAKSQGRNQVCLL